MRKLSKLVPVTLVELAEEAGISAVLAAKNVAVVPFGGGTSVVGGVAPLRGGHDAVVALEEVVRTALGSSVSNPTEEPS